MSLINIEDGIRLYNDHQNNTLNVRNKLSDARIDSISLYSLLGQLVSEWDVAGQDQQHIQVLLSNLSAGTYLVKIKTDKGEVNKRIIVGD